MERKYPTKMFWFFVLTNFLFHFFYLSVPGIILCIVGIWVKDCLWIGLAISMENSVESPLKTGNRTAIRSSNPTAGHTH